jgi:hypothetical protein
MALSDAYSTAASYREALTKRDSGKDEDVDADLLAISRFLERKLHTFFNKDDAAVVRYFMPLQRAVRDGWAEAENPWRYLRGNQYLHVDPIASTVGLQIIVDTDRDNNYADETALATADYILYPRNALAGPEPKPYTEIIRSDNSVWLPGAEVKITAIWGWPAVPMVIQRVCNQLCGILRFESPRARAISEIDGAMAASREAQSIIENLQRAYMKNPGWGIV